MTDFNLAVAKRGQFEMNVYLPVIEALTAEGRLHPQLEIYLKEALAHSKSHGAAGQQGKLYLAMVIAVTAMTLKPKRGRPTSDILSQLFDEENKDDE